MSITAVTQQADQLFAELKGKNPRTMSRAEKDSVLGAIWNVFNSLQALPVNDETLALDTRISSLMLPYGSANLCVFPRRNRQAAGPWVEFRQDYSSTIGELKQAAASALNIPVETIATCTIDTSSKIFSDNAYLTNPEIAKLLNNQKTYIFLNLA